MAEVGSAFVSLMFTSKGSEAQISRQLGSAGAGGGTAAAKGFKSRFTPGLKSIGGALAGAFAAAKVKDFLSSAVSEARESQKVGAITAQVIKTTGGAANVTAGQVGSLAQAISNKSGIDDEAIQSASNLLLTFTNLRNETGKGNDVFNQATQAATDMGAALGKPPKAAAIQLGKALNDPVKGITALTKVGVSFTAEQKKSIGVYMKQGKTVKAQKVILGELRKEFGGTAAASATSGEKASVAFSNLKEQIGTALLPVIDKLEKVFSTKIVPAVSKFLDQMKSGKGLGGDFAAVLGTIGTVVKNVSGWLMDHKGVIAVVIAAYAIWTAVTVALGIQEAISTGLLMLHTEGTTAHSIASGIAAAASAVWTGAQWLLNAALNANPIGLIILAIALLVGGFIIAYKNSGKFRDIIHAVWGALKNVGGFIKDVLLGAFHLLEKGFLSLAIIGVHAFRVLVTFIFKVFGMILSGAAKALGWIPGIGPKIKNARDAFARFGDRTVAKLKGVEDRLKGVRDGIGKIKPKKTIVITIKVKAQVERMGRAAAAAAQAAVDAVTRARGGPVLRGGTYLVGENGPELFRPNASGSIVPNSQVGGSRGIAGGGGTSAADLRALVAAINTIPSAVERGAASGTQRGVEGRARATAASRRVSR